MCAAGQCLEVLQLLKRNAKEQCRLNTQLGRDMWDRLMTPLQGATACVGMYPFVVRGCAVQCSRDSRRRSLHTACLQAMWQLLCTTQVLGTACRAAVTPIIACLQPDKLAILTVVAVRAGEPDAATLLSDDPPPGLRPSDKALASDSGAATDGSNAMVSGSE